LGRSYFYDLGEEDGRSIDASFIGNESRFINGSQDANCTAVTSEGRIYIEAAKAIRRGEELTLEYSFEGMPGHPT
jgi:SET domain-containing protein